MGGKSKGSKGGKKDKDEKEAGDDEGEEAGSKGKQNPVSTEEDAGDDSDDDGDASENGAGEAADDDGSEDEVSAGSEDDNASGEDESDDEGDAGSSGVGDEEEDEDSVGGSSDDDEDDEDEDGPATGQSNTAEDMEDGEDNFNVDPDSDSSADAQGTGAGSCFSANDPIDTSGLDLSSAIGKIVGDESAKSIKASPYTAFTRDFDKIVVCEITGQYNDAWLPKMEDDTRAMVGKMQKDVERMMAAQSRTIKIGAQRRGRLNAPNLHRIITGDDRVFAQKEVHRSKDTAVTLLVDNSGSMSGAKYTTAMIAAFALSSTLERVNIASEVIGFTTDYANNWPQAANDAYRMAASRGLSFQRVEPLRLTIFKEFDERLSPTVKKRFAFGAFAQPGRGGNVDGESLEFGAGRLFKRREKRKVMLVLSDGRPACNDMKAGEYHLKKTVEDLTKYGVDIVGIGIMDQAVKSFYPKHLVLPNLNDLPGVVMGQLKSILS